MTLALSNMTNFKKYRHRESGEIVEAHEREDGDFIVKDGKCPLHFLMADVDFVVNRNNFIKHFEEVKENE